MKISRSSWHYRLYVFMYQWNRAWCHDDRWYEVPNKKVGLCPYMRMILIWGPLAILSNLAPLGAIAAALFFVPFGINGWLSVLWLFVFFAGGAATIFGFVWWADYKSARDREREESQVELKELEPEETFWTLIKAYLVAAKTKICPIMEVQND